MINSKWRIAGVVILLAVLLTGCMGNHNNGPIEASGFIEGEEVMVAPQVSGRIAAMQVERGDEVQVGDVLIQLDDAFLQSQLLEAQAGLAAVEANLAGVQAGARAEEIAGAEAALAQAQADLEGATQAVLHAQEVISNPLSISADIDAARMQVDLAEQGVEIAEADLAEVQLRRGVYVGQGGDVERSWDLQVAAAEAALEEAQAQLDGARQYLNALWAIRADPLTLQAELHAAEMEQRLAEAQVAQAQATLDEMLAGPTAQELSLAEAQVRQAEALVQLVEAQLDQLTLIAPLDGVVTARSAQMGETATAGMTLLTIANLDQVTLVIYIPEDRIGQVRLGQAVEVRVDSFPGRVFNGTVASIAGEAEFTPRNVQTQEERVNLVFAVDVHISNPDRALKPGMPADALLVEE